MAAKRQKPIKLTKILNLPLFWFGLITLIVFFLRLPSLLEPHRYADEEIYLALGQAFRKGLVFYRDIHDNKPPLLYLVAALAGNLAWFRFILLCWHGVNVFIFWKLVKAIIPKIANWFAGIMTLLFAALTTIPLTEGNIANGENFMIMPATFGALLLWQYRKSRPSWAFFSGGLLFSIAFLFKIPALFDLLGIGVFLTIITPLSFKEAGKFIFSLPFWLLILGFVLPIVLSIVYYSLMGAFEPYVKAALLQNITYLSSWEGAQTSGLVRFLSNGLFQRGLVLFGVSGLLCIFKNRFSQATLFTSLWFVFSLFGALLPGRPYPHYLLEIIPSLILLIALLLKQKFLDKLAIILVIGLLPLAIHYYQFWYYRSLPYYQNFWEFALGKKSQEKYFAFFDGVNRNYQVAKYVMQHTKPEEKIFVWGTEPTIYALTNRLPVGRYTVSYHIVDFKAWQETLQALKTYKPSLIVFMKNEPHKFPELEALLSINYVPVKTINEAVIYHRL